jgi:hypothetical protein
VHGQHVNIGVERRQVYRWRWEGPNDTMSG